MAPFTKLYSPRYAVLYVPLVLGMVVSALVFFSPDYSLHYQEGFLVGIVVFMMDTLLATVILFFVLMSYLSLRYALTGKYLVGPIEGFIGVMVVMTGLLTYDMLTSGLWPAMMEAWNPSWGFAPFMYLVAQLVIGSLMIDKAITLPGVVVACYLLAIMRFGLKRLHENRRPNPAL